MNEEKYRQDLDARIKQSQQTREAFKQRFPKLMQNIEGVNLYNFECPKGWVEIVWELCEKLEKYEGLIISQAKQKLGSMRFYPHFNSTFSSDVEQDEVFSLIRDAERQADNICEWCGSTENVQLLNDGYISNSCQKCEERILSARS